MVEGLRRVFAGIAPPAEVRMAVAEYLADLTVPGRLIPPANWHVTLRFLGPIDQATYERFLGSMSQVDLGPGFRLRLSGIGGFPRPARATVTWVGVFGEVDRLGELAEISEQAAQSSGLTPEERPFDPHLTISRVRPPADIRHLLIPGGEIDIPWSCQDLIIYESHMGRGHPRYEPLEILELRR